MLSINVSCKACNFKINRFLKALNILSLKPLPPNSFELSLKKNCPHFNILQGKSKEKVKGLKVN